MSTSLKHVAVICGYPFPEGLAATNRIITYLRGLKEHNVKVDVFIYRPTEAYGHESNYPPHGYYDGIEYFYPGTRHYYKYKFIRVILNPLHKLIACYNIWKVNKSNKIDFLLISNDFIDILILYTFFAKINKIKPIFITDEYPQPIRIYLKPDIPKFKKKVYNFIVNKEDSLIFMTEKLNQFYNHKNLPYFILPTITNTSRFNLQNNNSIKSKYICYMGNMELSKDNVDNIIRAFSEIASKYPDIDLYLYGAPSTKDLNIIQSLISSLKLDKRVFIKGKASYNEVPNILSNAYILASSQPNTKRAEGGFPTKLGEYMSTGIPTILTNVGEISNYVQDGVHVHIVPPENPKSYAEKLEYIINNYTRCLSIAASAKQYIINNFDYKTVSKKLYNFLNSRLTK